MILVVKCQARYKIFMFIAIKLVSMILSNYLHLHKSAKSALSIFLRVRILSQIMVAPGAALGCCILLEFQETHLTRTDTHTHAHTRRSTVHSSVISHQPSVGNSTIPAKLLPCKQLSLQNRYACPCLASWCCHCGPNPVVSCVLDYSLAISRRSCRK